LEIQLVAIERHEGLGLIICSVDGGDGRRQRKRVRGARLCRDVEVVAGVAATKYENAAVARDRRIELRHCCVDALHEPNRERRARRSLCVVEVAVATVTARPEVTAELVRKQPQRAVERDGVVELWNRFRRTERCTRDADRHRGILLDGGIGRVQAVELDASASA
jgi:hypothetical protein